MESTHQTHPRVPVQVGFMAFRNPAATTNSSFNTDVSSRFIDLIIDQSVPMAEHGWGGYISVNSLVQGVNSIVLVNPVETLDQARADMAPFQDFVSSSGATVLVNLVLSFPSFYNAFHNVIATDNGEGLAVGLAGTLGSRLL